MSTRRNPSVLREICKIMLDRSGGIKFFRVTIAVKSDKAPHPIDIGCFSADRVMASADFCLQGIEQSVKEALHLARDHSIKKDSCLAIGSIGSLVLFGRL